MKRFISAVLVPCFLLQLFGCSSTREIVLNDLQDYNNVVIKTKDGSTYFLNTQFNDDKMLKNPDGFFYTKWIVVPDSQKVILERQKVFRVDQNTPNIYRIEKDKTEIYSANIETITSTNINLGKTFLFFGLGIVAFAGLLVLAAFAINSEWH